LSKCRWFIPSASTRETPVIVTSRSKLKET
jgi:hypothetical protein